MRHACSFPACLCARTQDFRTGFIVLCAPKAMFAAQLMGALAGALLAPLTFALFWATGKVCTCMLVNCAMACLDVQRRV